jgi:hypothetical protein
LQRAFERTPCKRSRVSARDSGKPMVDAAFGEVMVTCEKIWWLVKEGAQYLLPERRKAGAMVGAACVGGHVIATC